MKRHKRPVKLICFLLAVSMLLTGCTADDISDGLLAVEDLFRDVYHAARDIIEYEEPEPEPKKDVDDKEPEDIAAVNDYVVESISGSLYGYNTLEPEEQRIYDEMLSCILHQAPECVVSTLDSVKLRSVYDVMRADHGELFWSSGYECVTHTVGDEITRLDFKPGYTMSEMERANIQNQIDDVAADWLSGIEMNASDYDKSKYVFELLINNVEYDLDAPNNQNIISVFIGGATVCQGYASAAQYLLRKLGIEAIIIIGTAQDEDHAWNLVKLNGTWYFMDVTWGNSEYTEGDSTKKFVNYTYLNMTTADIEKTHTPRVGFELPLCESMSDNYFYREGLYYTYLQPDVMGGWLRRAYDEQMVVTFKLSDDALFNKTVRYFIDEDHVMDYCPGLKGLKYIIDESSRTVMFRFDEMDDIAPAGQ